MELIGPTELITVMDSWSQGYTMGILELQPVDPVLLSWGRKVCEIANDRLRGRPWGERGDWLFIINDVFK